MKSGFLKKIVASAVIFSLTFSLVSQILSRPQVVQADDFDDFDDYDDRYDDLYDDDRYDDRYDDYYDYDDRYDDYYDDDYYGKPIFNNGANNNIKPVNPKPNNARPVVSTTANQKMVADYLKNVYKNVFAREIDQPGLNYWTQRLSSGQIELEDFFKNLLSEGEFRQAAPTVEDKIKKLYLGIFQREADQGGLQFWISRYKQELREEGNEREALRDVIDDMTDGTEFKQLLLKLGLRLD